MCCKCLTYIFGRFCHHFYPPSFFCTFFFLFELLLFSPFMGGVTIPSNKLAWANEKNRRQNFKSVQYSMDLGSIDSEIHIYSHYSWWVLQTSEIVIEGQKFDSHSASFKISTRYEWQFPIQKLRFWCIQPKNIAAGVFANQHLACREAKYSEYFLLYYECDQWRARAAPFGWCWPDLKYITSFGTCEFSFWLPSLINIVYSFYYELCVVDAKQQIVSTPEEIPLV